MAQDELNPTPAIVLCEEAAPRAAQVIQKADDQSVARRDAPSASAPDSLLSTNERQELETLLSLSARRTRDHYRTLARLSARLAAQERAVGKKWEDEDTAELDALIAQYESLREESMHTINNRIQTMLLGLAAVGALAAGSLTVDKPTESKALIYGVFSGAIPLVCIFVLLVWVSEAMRAHRVGYFLAADAEARINAKLGRLVMTWEASLWTRRLPRDELFGPSMMAMAVFGVIAVFAPLFGLALSGTQLGPVVFLLLVLGVPYTLLLAAALYVLLNMSRLKNEPVLSSTLADEDAGSPRM